MLGFKHLQAFVAVVEENSFTKAAEKLYQTQPALSIQIKNLEKSLGIQLIERKEKEIYLTEAGSIFYQEAKKILASLERTKEGLDELKKLGRGILSIGASTLPGEYIIPSVLEAFHKLYPSVKIDLKIKDTGQIVEYLTTRQVQVGFLGARTSDSRLDLKEFRKDELCLITGPDYQIQRDWERFPWEDLILREKGSGTRQVVEEYLVSRFKLKNNPVPKMEVESTRAIINLVAAGLGISFVSRWAAQESLELGRIKIVPVSGLSFTRTIYCAVLKEGYLSHAARAFLDLLDTK